jgi:hypothetical protein
MPGVPRELIEHALNVDPKAMPKKQRLRRFAHDKREAIKREIAKLLAAGFIKEVIHPEWVANPVLVKKKNNEWRMCVDYTDLNKHCPKDHFGLPRIDQVVDSTAGCVLLCFLDCYSGYHQIALKEEDQIKTAFITPYGTYARDRSRTLSNSVDPLDWLKTARWKGSHKEPPRLHPEWLHSEQSCFCQKEWLKRGNDRTCS